MAVEVEGTACLAWQTATIFGQDELIYTGRIGLAKLLIRQVTDGFKKKTWKKSTDS